ncbi:MAG: hypothetical protein KDD70_08810 [Bdellovibrionales bacterium]|nr:hypothetical protein [Bdellovibrionales bacterium]
MTSHPPAQAVDPAIRRRRSAKTLSYYTKLWQILFITLPLDFYLAPLIVRPFEDALRLLPNEIQITLVSVLSVLMLAPLAKELLINLTLESQGLQKEARSLKVQFQSLFSALLGIVVIVDVARRFAKFGWEYVLGVAIIGLLFFPSWYRSMKRNTEEAPLEEYFLHRDADQIFRAIQQFQWLLLILFMIGRLACFLVMGFVSIYPPSTMLQIETYLASSFIFLSAKPVLDDLFRVCRKCGLWSHRAYQIDGYCPGCARLALKSSRFRQRKSRLTPVRNTLEKIDKGLEALKLPQRRTPKGRAPLRRS